MSGDSKVSCPRQRQLLDYLYLVTRQAFGALRSHDESAMSSSHPSWPKRLRNEWAKETAHEFGTSMTHAFTATPNAIAVTHHAKPPETPRLCIAQGLALIARQISD